MTRVDEARRGFEEALGNLRGSLGRELGGRPRAARGWAVPLIAFAAGLGVALTLRRRRKKKKK